MKARFHPTVRQLFAFSLLGLLLGLSLLFYLVLHASEEATLNSSERYRELASRYVAHLITSYLDEAPMAVTRFQEEVNYGIIDTGSVDSVEQGLLSLLLANDNLSEATLTFAKSRGFDQDGNIVTDRASAGQVAVLRTSRGQYVSKKTWFDGKQFVSESTILNGAAPVSAQAPTSPVPAADPTAHLTFQTTASSTYYDPASADPTIKHGRIISTDLHWSQIDETLPQDQRRIEVSVQKVIEDARGHFAGVLRVGLMKTQIDRAVQQHITGKNEKDPHLIFICDNDGRLITGFGNGGHVIVSGPFRDLRIAQDNESDVVKTALREPDLKNVDESQEWATSTFRLGSKLYLCTFLYLPGTQDWILGIVVPRDFYLGSLRDILRFVLMTSLALIVAIVVAGGIIIQSVVRSQSLILKETSRMRQFEFSPSDHRSYFRDIAEVLVGLERAKTAMRAMSKYVPVDLVRRLYSKGEEPVLGGMSCELSIMFTDIKDFTAFAEQMKPDELADVLGRYLQVVAEAVQAENGTIDKYIGDAVMTFWNAPEPVAGHEVLACRAALRCEEALRKLYDSPGWGKAPRFVTRFGIHRCTALVGHFGSMDRFNYTAIGDGVNLTSRLEGLNKYYGTQVIVSETIHAAARDIFEFRLLDRVAVKGKVEGIVIYELISERLAGKDRPDFLNQYEDAFNAYQAGDFAQALELLDGQSTDSPSRLLAGRCREFLEHPPQDWNGIHVFNSK
jgi:adenylate cyclase